MSAWTILFVDDEAEILRALRREVESPLCRVVTESDPLRALDLVDDEGVDVLVADIQMPGMGGIELLAKAHERFPTVARLVLTGSTSMKSAIDAINTGKVLRYIQKPWSRDDLRVAIDEAFAWVQARHRDEERRSQTAARDAVRAEFSKSWPGLLDAVLVDGARAIDPERCLAAAKKLDAPALVAALEAVVRDR